MERCHTFSPLVVKEENMVNRQQQKLTKKINKERRRASRLLKEIDGNSCEIGTELINLLCDGVPSEKIAQRCAEITADDLLDNFLRRLLDRFAQTILNIDSDLRSLNGVKPFCRQ